MQNLKKQFFERALRGQFSKNAMHKGNEGATDSWGKNTTSIYLKNNF